MKVKHKKKTLNMKAMKLSKQLIKIKYTTSRFKRCKFS